MYPETYANRAEQIRDGIQIFFYTTNYFRRFRDSWPPAAPVPELQKTTSAIELCLPDGEFVLGTPAVYVIGDGKEMLKVYSMLKDDRPSQEAIPYKLFDLQEAKKGSRHFQYDHSALSVLGYVSTTTLPRPFLLPGEQAKNEAILRANVINAYTIENAINSDSIEIIAYNSRRYSQNVLKINHVLPLPHSTRQLVATLVQSNYEAPWRIVHPEHKVRLTNLLARKDINPL